MLKSNNFPGEVAEFLQSEWGISHLFPPQKEALEPLMKGQNGLICIPTASGKSLLAYLSIIKQIIVMKPGTQAIYIVPLKALAREKYEDLTALSEKLGIRVSLGVGDAGEEGYGIHRSDIMVCTSEKLDSMIRTNNTFLANVSIVIADEFHLLNDVSRGPTLEINMTRILQLPNKPQIVALSATVGNAKALANWLDAELIESDWRPIDLEYATMAQLEVEPRLVQSQNNNSHLKPPRTLSGPKSSPSWAVLKDTIESSGQLLIFVGTRKSAQSEAKKLSERLNKFFIKKDLNLLDEAKKLSEKIKSNASSSMGDELASVIKGGVAFHHAGLTSFQRKLIEDGFRQRKILALIATPTLAAGVNLPAQRVLVRDVKRWDGGFMRPLPVMEVRQMMGRAGRPQYDKTGEAWILAKGNDQFEHADELSERYIHGDVEEVVSKLSHEPALRFHLLSMIANGGLETRKEIGLFFSSTFLGQSYGDIALSEQIDEMLNWLVDQRFIRSTGVDEKIRNETDSVEEWDDEIPEWALAAKSSVGVSLSKPSRSTEAQFGFSKASAYRELIQSSQPRTIHIGTKYKATDIGIRVSTLYIDPLSASILLQGMRRAVRRRVRGIEVVTTFGLTHLVTRTPDFFALWAKSSDLSPDSELSLKSSLHNDEYLDKAVLEENHLGQVKSAWCLEMWMEEDELRAIEKKLGVSPGDIYYRIDLSTWLLYASRELLRIDDVFAGHHQKTIDELSRELDLLRQRIRSGCKPDLLDLVSLKGIGRARARTLASMGVRQPSQLLSMSKNQLSKLKSLRGWGPKIVENLLNQVKSYKINHHLTEKARFDDEPLPGEEHIS